MTSFDAAQTNAVLSQSIPRAWEMGVRFTELRAGYARAAVPMEGNANHFGTIYAGVIFTVAEVLGGGMYFASFPADSHYPLIRSMAIQFAKPGTGTLSAFARLERGEIERVRTLVRAGTKADYGLQITVEGDSGEVVASAVGQYQARPFRAQPS
jgi:acyl-coenzyme A thioesterase PaaI-like protein